MVSSRGAVVSAIAQSGEPTGFAFESGCQLRVKIIPPGYSTGGQEPLQKPVTTRAR